VFEPETRHLGKISKANSYNISAGSSLDTTPLIGAYLDVLHSVLLKLDIGRWQGLLHSPHLWGQVCTQKSVVSVKLITAMYEAGQSEYSAADLHKLLQWAKIKLPEQDTAGSNFSAQLATLVGKAQTLKLSRNRNKRAPLSKWLAEFNALLSALGWSQSRTLDTVEFQQLQRFNECIVDCASNDAVISEITAIQAYRLLLRHFRDTAFHRQTLLSGNTLPDVLGVLEAGGQVFDYVWLCGFSDAQWPQKSKADALLPKAFQQRLAMPFASEQRELVYTKALTHSLLHASGHCTVSYPISVDDTPAQLSPLVLRVLDDMQSSATKVNYLDETQNDVFKPGSAGLLACKENSASLFENVDDSSGSPLDTKSLHNGKAVKGGTGFLQAMASNPLRAYLRYRLELVALPAPLVGITALERGIVLHSVLERCWSELKNLQTLKSVDDAALAKRLQQWIDDQLGDLLRRRFSRVPQALVDVECKVLTDILQHWLQLERQRTDFEVIATEFDIHYELSGLPFRGRIDRIDKLANGTSLLIDYKSGATNVAGWLDEALLEPQLPFYVIALKQAKQNSLINGISFASLKPSAIGFKGLTADNDKSTEISGIRALSDTEIEAVESWQNLQVIWQQRLTEIAHQIKTGFAGLDSETEWSNDDYQPLTRASYFKELVQ